MEVFQLIAEVGAPIAGAFGDALFSVHNHETKNRRHRK